VAEPPTTRPAPFLEVRDVLASDQRAALATSVRAQIARQDVGDDIEVELVEHGPVLGRLLRRLSAVVRRELALSHFALHATPFVVTIQGPTGSVSSCLGSGPAPGTRRVEFIYTLVLDPGTVDCGAFRLFDTMGRDGARRAADTYIEIARVDNAMLFFPSDRHAEVTRVRAAPGRAGSAALVCSVSGWLAGDPIPPPDVDRPTLAALQRGFLPRITDGGFEVRPIPDPVHRLLRGLLALRASRAQPEEADRAYHHGPDPEMTPIGDVADELLRHLQSLHEAWCGVRLGPSAAYGMRRYRAGSVLDMHVDRPDTHVVSSVLQIAQDVDEPWPLRLDVDGRHEDVLLAPGQMVLYEGAVTAHGRPTPFEGREFVNVFLHYRPVDWPWSREAIIERARADGMIDRIGRLRS